MFGNLTTFLQGGEGMGGAPVAGIMSADQVGLLKDAFFSYGQAFPGQTTQYSLPFTAATGRDFDAAFKPDLTPREMLEFGVFSGKYMNCRAEFPASWFKHARLAPSRRAHPPAGTAWVRSCGPSGTCASR